MFQKDMEDRSKAREARGELRIPGVTLPSIMTYLNDETTPPVEFLLEAARVLNVRLGWLLEFEGPARMAEQHARPFAGSDSAPLRSDLFSRLRWLTNNNGPIEAQILEIVGAFHIANEYRAELMGAPAPTPEESAREFELLLIAPVRWWPSPALRDTAFWIEPNRALEYLHAALLAVMLSIPDGRNVTYIPRDTGAENEERRAPGEE